MPRTYKGAVWIFFGGITLGIVLLWPHEPSYKGKSLTFWIKKEMQRLDDPSPDPEAQAALQSMGTNAIPWLLEKLQYRDSALKTNFTRWADHHPKFRLRLTSGYEINLQAANGFILLGEKAQPAIPTLKLLMDNENENLAMFAMASGSNMGSNSIPLLIKGLTNRHSNIRNEAASLLISLPSLSDLEERKLAIPALTVLLNDPSEDTRKNAAKAIREIDPSAAANIKIPFPK